MRKPTDAIYSFGENAIKYLFLVFVGGMALSAIVFTEYANNMAEQLMILSIDRMYITVPISLGLVCLCLIAGVVVKKWGSKILNVLVGLVCIWYFILGTILILRARSAPGADAMTVYYMANALSNGDLSIVSSSDSYLSFYPQQIGLTTFLAVILKVLHCFNLPAAEYHFIKFIYLIMICAATVSQNAIVRKLWKDDFINAVFLILSAANLPYILYSTFIYNEIPSYFFFSVGAYLLTALMAEDDSTDSNISKRDKVIKLIRAALSIIFFSVAVMLRKNVLVLIIAVAITVIFQLIKSKRIGWMVYTITCVVCCVAVLPVVLWGYEQAADAKINSGVTAKSYFAMGMQEGNRGPGWYNGFNFETFEASGMDAELADIISENAIAERKMYFKENPGYAIKFYLRKISTQWMDGTYASLQATQATESNRSQFFWQVYEGKYTNVFNLYCDAYQTLIYFGTLICMLGMIIKKEKGYFWKYMFAIGVFGGFLFHIIWEANSRYILTYSLLMIPYTAKGLALLYEKIKNISNKRKQNI